MKTAIVLTLMLAACGGGSDFTSQVCTPGAQTECACPGGAKGAQACKDDGSGFAACSCGAVVGAEPDAATAAEGGSGGGSGGSGSANACGAGQTMYNGSCCTLRTCEANPNTGEGDFCGALPDNCGGTINCSPTCAAGVCGGIAPEAVHLCTCWKADFDTAYPCPQGTHNYSCQAGTSLALVPTISGCYANALDHDGARWCCP